MPSAASALKTRDKLLDAAFEFLGAGQPDASVHDIAARAGVSVGSVYSHFDDKAALFDAALAAAVTRSIHSAPFGLDDFDNPSLGGMAMGLWAIHRFEFEPELARALLSSRTNNQSALASVYSTMAPLIRESVAQGKAQCDDVDAVVTIAAGTYQALMSGIDHGIYTVDDAYRTIWQVARLLGIPADDYAVVVERIEREVVARRNKDSAATVSDEVEFHSHETLRFRSVP